MPRIVIIGALVYDLVFAVPDWVQPNRAVHASGLTISPGGKGLNQAAAASRLGADAVRLVGCVGDDIFGADMLAALRRAGVDTAFIDVHADARTSIAAIIVRNNLPGFVGAPDASRRVSRAQIRAALADLRPGDVLLVGFEVPQSLVAYALGLGRAAGATTVVNPAPFFTRDKFAIKYLYLVDWLIPNVTEAELLTGVEDLAVSDFADILREKGVGNVIITMGEHGSLLVAENDFYTQDAFPVEAVDTTGASDAFVGAFCASLAQAWTPSRALQFASAAAALACTKPGTMTALPDRSEVEALLAGAQLDPPARVLDCRQ
ncbi:MAG: ribokinase [Chloroflexi bacterium]|nr:ribokinase [Chloroflexota bacterium]MCY3581101.1 ribokinase [Chloroflexota bacterium]MCY3715622.1 ribokinase [Chloroflexota bacterium]MDE2650640.1 ribokinase [Chloroflexota bacterium]MXX50481.1 ribokinase [Chloroflexota bacterium]